MLCGLTSRWMTLASWRYTKAEHTSRNMHTSSSGFLRNKYAYQQTNALSKVLMSAGKQGQSGDIAKAIRLEVHHDIQRQLLLVFSDHHAAISNDRLVFATTATRVIQSGARASDLRNAISRAASSMLVVPSRVPMLHEIDFIATVPALVSMRYTDPCPP